MMTFPVLRVDRHEPFNALVVGLALAAGFVLLLVK